MLTREACTAFSEPFQETFAHASRLDSDGGVEYACGNALVNIVADVADCLKPPASIRSGRSAIHLSQLFRRPHMLKHHQQHQIVYTLQSTANQQRPPKTRHREQVTCESRADRGPRFPTRLLTRIRKPVGIGSGLPTMKRADCAWGMIRPNPSQTPTANSLHKERLCSWTRVVFENWFTQFDVDGYRPDTALR